MLIETPGLLLQGTEAEYLQKMKDYYKSAKIVFPEEKKDVILYVSDDDVLLHILRGIEPSTGKLSGTMNPYRAHRILWVQFVVEKKEIRSIYRAKRNGNIIFVCEDLKYCVFCSEQKGANRYKIITAYFKGDLREFNDTNRYEKIY